MADITITGNTTADPELRFTPNGQAVLNFNLAENHRKKVGDQWQDDGTTFYRVAVWGKQAETLADHLTKGARVLVSGRFRGGEFTSKQGEQVKTYEVTANQVGVVPKAEQQQSQQGYAQRYTGDLPPGAQGYAQNSQEAMGGWGQPANHQNQWDSPQSSQVPF